MNIALDYDHTFTRDPKFWLGFVDAAHQAGHHVYCVTMRTDKPSQAAEVRAALKDHVRDIIFTDYKAKAPFVAAKNLEIHVWIDDMPNTIHMDVAPWP